LYVRSLIWVVDNNNGLLTQRNVFVSQKKKKEAALGHPYISDNKRSTTVSMTSPEIQWTPQLVRAAQRVEM